MICLTCQSPTNSSDPHCRTCGASLTAAPAIAPSSEDLAAGTLLGKHYRILERLGRGGFGITYRGFDALTKNYVAIKELFPDGAVTRHSSGWVVPADRNGFERLLVRMEFEAKTLQLLRHKSATRAIDFIEANGTGYLVMEFMGGETLEARIESGKKLLNIEAREILFVILSVLEELHGLALLHRDIKPANIMLNREGQGGQRVELIDFGSLVKYRAGERARFERMLTPMYAPLEQYGENVELAPATDFYALGATLYHALTLRPPPSALERAKGAVLTPIRDLEPAIDAGLARFVMASLEMRLDDRPQNVSNARKILTHVKVQLDKFLNVGANLAPSQAIRVDPAEKLMMNVLGIFISVFLLVVFGSIILVSFSR